jgi:hypothetical protein
MAIPPSIKSILPSLTITERGTGTRAVLSLADLKKLVPSLEIVLVGDEAPLDGKLELSMDDLRKIFCLALSGINVDESWYLSQVPALKQDLSMGKFESSAAHYRMHGYQEGKLPEKPVVDEKSYLKTYPDIAEAIKAGRIKSGFDHFVADGYREGRNPTPSEKKDRLAGKPKGNKA